PTDDRAIPFAEQHAILRPKRGQRIRILTEGRGDVSAMQLGDAGHVIGVDGLSHCPASRCDAGERHACHRQNQRQALCAHIAIPLMSQPRYRSAYIWGTSCTSELPGGSGTASRADVAIARALELPHVTARIPCAHTPQDHPRRHVNWTNRCCWSVETH